MEQYLQYIAPTLLAIITGGIYRIITWLFEVRADTKEVRAYLTKLDGRVSDTITTLKTHLTKDEEVQKEMSDNLNYMKGRLDERLGATKGETP